MADGATVADHAASGRAQFAKFGLKLRQAPAETEREPPYPDELDYLWRWFREVELGGTPGGMGPSRVTWSDVADWSVLSGTALEPWEARTIVLLGAVRAGVDAERLKDANAKWRSRPASSRSPPSSR